MRPPHLKKERICLTLRSSRFAGSFVELGIITLMAGAMLQKLAQVTEAALDSIIGPIVILEYGFY
ncbi:hypothetical protein BH20ACI2_BH20ACI2_21670 [soil metagenome]